jgi:hypothetical protein
MAWNRQSRAQRRACLRALAHAAASATLALPAVAMAQGSVELAGNRYPTSITVGGSDLLLNGAGIRYRFVVRVYTAGLYLTKKADTPQAVLALPGPKRMHVVMQREIDAEQLGRLFTRGMQDNTPRDIFARSIPGTLRLAEMFAARKKLVAGDSFSVDWLPGVGTQILVNGQPQGAPVKEPEFFQALMLIWLGGHPADAQLKEALLGHEVKPVVSPGQQQ